MPRTPLWAVGIRGGVGGGEGRGGNVSWGGVWEEFVCVGGGCWQFSVCARELQGGLIKTEGFRAKAD